MYQYTGHVWFFVNARFWKKYDVRVKASTLNAAIRQAVSEAKENLKPRTRIVGVEVRLERLGKIVAVDVPADVLAN